MSHFHLAEPTGPTDHVLGADHAPVTVVEYGDFECPHCGRAYPIVRELQQRFGSRLRFVFRHFPLTQVHPHAQNAAEAAEAAAAQGHFHEMHAALFRHQSALSDRNLAIYAKNVGLDIARFQKELEEHIHADRVREDFASGVRSGVNGTPTFFINGERFDGVPDFESLLVALTPTIPHQG